MIDQRKSPAAATTTATTTTTTTESRSRVIATKVRGQVAVKKKCQVGDWTIVKLPSGVVKDVNVERVTQAEEIYLLKTPPE